MRDGTEVIADTQLSLVTSILGSLDDLSHKIQETNPIKFVVFDLVMLNGVWLTEEKFNEVLTNLQIKVDNMIITQEDFEEKKKQYKTQYSCRSRLNALNKIYNILKLAGMNNYIDKPRSTMINKDEFYKNILNEGGERSRS